MNKFKQLELLDISLQLFDGEGGTGEGGESAPAPSGEKDVANPKSSSKPKVIYGKQEEPTDGEQNSLEGTDPPETKPRDVSTEFEQLIKGDYKQAFDERVQKIINRRFKDVKTLETQIQSQSKVMELLQAKYGTQDLAELEQMVDKEVIQDLAYQNDMTPENYRKVLNAEKIERQQEIARQESIEQQKINETIQGWEKQANELKEIYPGFELREALQNDQFVQLLKANIPVKSAYELLNFDEVKSRIAKDAQSQVTQNIQAKKQRPKENAAKGNPSVVVKSDVHSFTKQDREEIAKRAQRGEKISL